MKKIHDQLLEIWQGYPEMVKAYIADITEHDLNVCLSMKAGDRWLWMLRDCGTVMFPIAQGQLPGWATYWLDERQGHGQTIVPFLITVTKDQGLDGTVRPITHERAIKLANEPPPPGFVYWRSDSPFKMTYVAGGKELGWVRAYAGNSWHNSLRPGLFYDLAAAKSDVERNCCPLLRVA